jgi:hypothetical protein
MPFLAAFEPRALIAEVPPGYKPLGLFLGNGSMGLEVAVFECTRHPTVPEMRALHRDRAGKHAAPVMVVALWGEGSAALCAAVGDEAVVLPHIDRALGERICASGLSAPDRHAAQRQIAAALPQLQSPLPGVRNSGLFAFHQLEHGVPARRDWAVAAGRASAALPLRGRALVQSLGFQVQPTPGPVSVLLADDRRTAVAVFLERQDQIEPPSPAFDNLSPVSYALAAADRENLEYVLVSAGATLRLYPVKPSVGTGRRGRTETYIELDLSLLSDAHSAYLWLIFSSQALAHGGSFDEILRASEDYAAELGLRLRERVYDEVVPQLADALARALKLRRPSPRKIAETYDMALLILFRLLFIAYAEDKDLLPLHTSAAYHKHSLKEMAKHLAESRQKGTPLENMDFYWTEVTQLCKAVEAGNRGWRVPEYDGGLFTSGDDASPAARALAEVSIPDRDFAPALAALLLDQTPECTEGPIDFRSLGVREFGTIYEGLLESELSVAEMDLAVDEKTLAFRPAGPKDKVAVPMGRVYLHDASGARKASGAYYTKPFAVEHLLDRALEPALDDHISRLDAIRDDREAADRFFEFRIADIAMGSGHFLVAAVDRTERRLSNYLAKRPLAGVRDELERLRQTALEKLGEDWGGDSIEDARLLRRQIARRCIYGVDLNPLAVELARLSLWIHTFVPGLPLSFLDANLVAGNSLVGIATFDEASELIRAGRGELFSFVAAERLGRAREPLERLAHLAEATAAEVKEARRLYERVLREVEGERALLTVLAASRVDEEIQHRVNEGSVATKLERQGDVFTDAVVRRAEKALEGLRPFHFPVVFPQVFLGARGGFDCILGNPPWKEATTEEDAFWARHEPGLRALPQREQESRKRALREERPDLLAEYEETVALAERLRAVLTSGPYPGMGTGDPDVYKAFCWRFWNLVSPRGGRIGVVLPRTALTAKGSTEFRKQVFNDAKDLDVTMLSNTGGWVFDDTEHRYTVALVRITRGEVERTPVALRGPYASLDRFRHGVVREPIIFYGEEIETWNDTASLPLLPTEESVVIFTKLRRLPRLDLSQRGQWRARPQAELHATNDKPLMDLRSKTCPQGFWPVFKGKSFDLWTPDTGKYYAFADPKELLPALQDKRLNSARTVRSAFSEFPMEWLRDERTLPCLRPRVAFRDITNRTNQRTVIVALIPGEVFLTNTAPYFVWPRGNEQDQAYLLGVLSSVPLDWYARRFVETHLNFFVLNPFPVPRPQPDDSLRRRVVELSARLATEDRRLHAWGRAAGVMPARLADDERDDMIRELDAAVALLCGLTEKDLAHVFETFHEGWDYQDRLDATLIHMGRLEGKA